MLRLHVSCAVVAEVVLKLTLAVHVVNSQLHLTGFQPNTVAVQPNNLLTFAAPPSTFSFYRLIQHMMHITAHGCGVWGVLPLQHAMYVVFSLDCVDICTIHYTLYTIHYVYVGLFFACIRRGGLSMPSFSFSYGVTNSNWYRTKSGHLR